MKAALRLLLVFLALGLAVSAGAAKRPIWLPGVGSSSRPAVVELQYGGARLVLSYNPGDFRLTEAEISDWILRSARAVATYIGRFPMAKVHIAIEAASGAGVVEGEAWASPAGHIRVWLGRRTTAAQLKRKSAMVHEMMHLGFPDLDEAHLWLHEGIATYVEAVARAQSNEAAAPEVWGLFVGELPQGLPQRGDGGLDHTRRHRRVYWGGAIFCLFADVQIRQRTANRFGLGDALRGVLKAGGTLADTWPVERVLAAGDRAVGVPVLSELYAAWKDKAAAPDLDDLWRQLGVRVINGRARLDDAAPLAAIRLAITGTPARPLLLSAPKLVHETDAPGSPLLQTGPKLVRERQAPAATVR